MGTDGSDSDGSKKANRAQGPSLSSRYSGLAPAGEGLVNGQEFRALHIEDVTLLDTPDFDISELKQTSTDRAVSRYLARRADFAFSAAYLEGNSFTLPEVHTLIDKGVTPEGKSVADVDQILSLTEASELLLAEVQNGPFELKHEESDTLNGILVRHEAVDAGIRRVNSRINSDGRGATVNVMGDKFIGMRVLGLRKAEPILEERIASIKHPAIRAANYAAMTTYMQQYFDGNKRTARYMMDGELMSHGFDAVAIPSVRFDEYHRSVAQMFRTGDMRHYARFLLDVARRGDPVD